jgi:uncharacterized phage-associated protein
MIEAMTTSARDVAAALRERLPDLPIKKLHKLLYYCQGHHLAQFGEPLFADTISAWDMGPVVGVLWKVEREESEPVVTAGPTLDEAQLNTIGYVVSRYGRLTGRELEILTHGEMPWRRANEHRGPQGSVRIEEEWIEEQFRAAEVADREDETPFGSDALADVLDGMSDRARRPGRIDALDEIRAWATRAA